MEYKAGDIIQAKFTHNSDGSAPIEQRLRVVKTVELGYERQKGESIYYDRMGSYVVEVVE